MLDSRPVFFPLFTALLMANGWFMRPRPFTYQGDGKNPMQRIPMVMLTPVPVCLAVGRCIRVPTHQLGFGCAVAVSADCGRGVRRVYTSFQTTGPASN